MAALKNIDVYAQKYVALSFCLRDSRSFLGIKAPLAPSAPEYRDSPKLLRYRFLKKFRKHQRILLILSQNHHFVKLF